LKAEVRKSGYAVFTRSKAKGLFPAPLSIV